jgi:hypothetical protein
MVVDAVPGMDSGCTLRNATVGVAYLVGLAVIAVVVRTYRPYRGC